MDSQRMDSAPAWLITARDLKGTLEAPGSADNQVILGWARDIGQRWGVTSYAREYAHDSIPWCGLFVAHCLSANGIRPVDEFLWARNWAKFGTPVSDPRPGDIVVFTRGEGGHVAFFEGLDGDGVKVTGGNQSDSVSTAHYPAAHVIAYRRPPAPEKLPVASNIPEWTGCGKGSWYSQYQGKYSWVDEGDRPNSNALGVPDDKQGCSFYDKATLGKWFDVEAPNSRVLRLQQTDIGPHPRTGRKIDIAAVAAERFGYTPTNFPTDSIFKWRPAVADTPIPQWPEAQSPDSVNASLAAINKKLDTVLSKPEVKQSFGAFAMVAIKAAQAAFPQFAVFGALAQFLLASAGFMGTAMGDAATPTGQVTGATMLSLLASWAVSKINKVAK